MARAPDGGQALPLLAAVVAVGLLVLLAAGRLVSTWASAARARTAADAAALACLESAGSAHGVARAVAAANGARLVSASTDGTSCTVRVVAGGAEAEATAAWRERGVAEIRQVRHAG